MTDYGARVPRAASDKVFKYRWMTIWAEDGVIFIADDRDQTFIQMTQEDATERLAAWSRHTKFYEDSKEDSGSRADKAFYAEKYMMHQRFMEGMHKILLIARDQGNPTDEKVRAYHAKSNPKSYAIADYKSKKPSCAQQQTPGKLWVPPGSI